MASSIFQSVTNMAHVIREEDNSQNGGDVDDDDEEDIEHAQGFGTETDLLERVVQKLAVLTEITVNKSLIDAKAMENLGDADRALIHEFQGHNSSYVMDDD